MLSSKLTLNASGQHTQIELSWHLLRLFNYYRALLGVVLFCLFLVTGPSTMLGKTDGTLFYFSNMLYLLFACVCLYAINGRTFRFQSQLLIQVLVDIIALTLIIYASNGLSSGLGILLVITIACSSLLMSNRQAIFFASIATLAILLQTVYADIQFAHQTVSYTHAGLLGIALLSTSLVSVYLSNRVSESEARVIQKEFDLANLEQLNDYIIQNFHTGILVIDQYNEIRLINESARALFGKQSASKNKPIESLSNALANQIKLWRNQHKTVLSDQENPEAVVPCAFKADESGRELVPKFITLGQGPAAGIIVFLEDAADLSDKLQQIKLAALGRLTASIAHEIRNPLSAINHAAQLLEESPNTDQDDIRLSQIIISHANRMNTIVQNILQLSRKETSQAERINLQPWLTRFRQEFCLNQAISEDQIKIDIQPEDTQVEIDSGHLFQIMSNLCENALRHSQASIDRQCLIQLVGGRNQDNQECYLEVIDFGSGIDEDTATKMFEPFFTTSNSGTGLGLYITRELCEYNKARLNYVRAKHGGSCFRLVFHECARVKV